MIVLKKIILPNGWEIEIRIGMEGWLLVSIYDKEGYLISEMKVSYKEEG